MVFVKNLKKIITKTDSFVHNLPNSIKAKREIRKRAIIDSFIKLNPKRMLNNPVMFLIEICSILTAVFFIQSFFSTSNESTLFIGLISLWLWFTVLFSNFSEALAEGRGRAEAETLKRMRTTTQVKRLKIHCKIKKGMKPKECDWELVSSADLKKEDIFFVQENETIPVDGEIIYGIASVDESAITGESAPVVREAGGDRSAVTGGTKLLSDWLIIKVTSNPGEGFLDRMILLIEGAERKKTPNEIALNTLLYGLTFIFLVICISLWTFSEYSIRITGQGTLITFTLLISLFVCLAPTTICGLLSAIGIAGMDRLIQKNVIAFSGQAIEAAGDVDVLLLDKTGTITLGNRQAVELITIDGHDITQVAEITQLASLADETPEGRSIVILIKEKYGLRGLAVGETDEKKAMKFIPFSAQTKMSGVDIDSKKIRKGASDVMYDYIKKSGNNVSPQLKNEVERISRSGGTPLIVTLDHKAVGVIHLKDIVKGGIKERFAQLRKMGIRTVMITGDNKLTAASIGVEAGVDDFLAESTPEEKLKLIREYQSNGKLVAMTGDGTNDAPALAQADVAVAMNTGTQPAREAANMIDLDSNPTKLIEIVETGKQLLMTRGALTTFSITNDIAKYFVIIPAAFASTYPVLGELNILALTNPILSAVIFNALIIILLVPLALRGVTYKPMTANQALRKNLLFYGLGGIIVPFIGIKLIDLALSLIGVYTL
jgi:K+-transporting ATPase ATPase B chain